MKQKLFTLLLALLASAGTIFAESGTCGDNLTWNLTDGVLTISGTGPMTNYSNPINKSPLFAETNMADIETSCGFEWKRNDAPADMAGTKPLPLPASACA